MFIQFGSVYALGNAKLVAFRIEISISYSASFFCIIYIIK